MNTPFTVSTQMKEQMRCLKRDVKVNNSGAVETPSRLGRPGRNGIVLVQPQCHILRQLVIRGFLDIYPILGVFELDPLLQKPGVGIMSSTATCVLPMKLGPKPVTRQSNSSPRFEFSRRII